MDQIIGDENAFIRMPKTPFGSVEKNFHIKRKPYTNSCTFLEEGKCTIHQFKLFGCRIFPFQFKFTSDNEVIVSIHESNFCPSVLPIDHEKALNEKFLKSLLSTLKSEIEYRKEYLSKYGNTI